MVKLIVGNPYPKLNIVAPLRTGLVSGTSKSEVFFALLVGFFVFLLLFSDSVFGQPYFDVAVLQYQQSRPTIGSENQKRTLSSDYFSAELNVPLKSGKDIWLLNPVYETYHLRFSDSVPSERIHGIGMPIAFVKQWKKEAWSTTFVLLPRLAGDLKNPVDRNDAQLGGVVLNTYKKKKELSWKFGLYYNSEHFGPFIMPLLGLDWKASAKINVFGVLPGSMNAEYSVSKRFHYGLAFRALTCSYRLNNFGFIRMDDNQLKAYADFYIAKSHVLTFEAGHTILREYKPGIRLGGKSEYTNLEIHDGLLFKVAYAFRVSLEDKD